jgi:hypothetical protein
MRWEDSKTGLKGKKMRNCGMDACLSHAFYISCDLTVLGFITLIIYDSETRL